MALVPGGPGGLASYAQAAVQYLASAEDPLARAAADYFGSTIAGFTAGAASPVPYGAYIGGAGGALGAAYRIATNPERYGFNSTNSTNATNYTVPLLTYNATPAVNFTSIPAARILDPGFGRPGTTFRYDGRGRGRSVFYRRPPSGSHRGTFGWRQFPDRDSALRWMYRARSRVWRGRHGVIRRHRGPRVKAVRLFGGGYGPRRFHGSRGVSSRRVFKVRNGAVTRFIRR